MVSYILYSALLLVHWIEALQRLPSDSGFRMRWMKLNGALAPMRSTLCLSRTGLCSSPSHSTISWHSGIHWPGTKWSASFLEIWGQGTNTCLTIFTNYILVVHASPRGKWMVLFSSPSLSPFHPLECPKWSYCSQNWPGGQLPSLQSGHSALSQPVT